MILVYITCKDKEEAKKIAKHLLDNRLAACANIFPIESMYCSGDKLEQSNEVVLLVKTRKYKFDKVKEEVKKIHSYEIPCILKIDVEANKGYDSWLDGVVG